MGTTVISALYFLHFLFFIKNLHYLYNNESATFDSVTKSKCCWSPGVAFLCATLGLGQRDKLEKAMEETEMQCKG